MKRTWRNAASFQVDPDNRLVATVGEAEWNTKLRELEEARAVEAQYNQSDQHQVSDEERAEIEGVPQRFRQFWSSPKTTVRERKRAVRLLIEDVTVHKTDQIVAHIRFKGGATQTIVVPPPVAQSRLTAPETLAAMERLLEEYTDTEVAEQLNRASLSDLGWTPLGDASMSINCVGITAFQIGTPDYARKAWGAQKNWREAEESPLKGCGEDTIKDVLLGCGTMTVDRVSFLSRRRTSNRRWSQIDSDQRDEVHYTT